MSRLFLLEDHSWFRKALADLLEREPDLEVVAQAGSLSEARREAGAQAERIDLAVVDLLLPDGIGTDLIRDLRAWVRSMGADEMISKDASVEEILAAVRVLLVGRDAR